MRPLPRFLLLATTIVLLGTGSGLRARQSGGPPLPAPVVRYTLSATLDPANRLVLGQGRVEWRNSTLTPTSEIRLLLPWNSRRHDRTTWANERRLSLPSSPSAASDADRGFMDLTSLQLVTPAGPVDVLARAKAIAPEDGNTEDHTVWQVTLDAPVPPGHSVDLEFNWNGQVPVLADGIGVSGDTFVLGQWFPRLGVLTDDGWQAHQVHAGSASFTPFGHYDVALRVPSGWLVGGTGTTTGRDDHDDRSSTHRFRAENAPDFAWATGPRLLQRTDRFEGAGHAPVNLRLLIEPQHLDQADRQLTAAKTALRTYADWFGRYPWTDLTLVDVPDSASSGSFPGLVPIRTRWLSPWTGPDPERDIVTRLAEQYWNAAALPDSVTHAWLGTGLAQYSAGRALDTSFEGRFVTIERYFDGLVAWPYADVRWNRTRDGAQVSQYRLRGESDAVATPAWQRPAAARDLDTIARTPLTFMTLERLLGWDTVRQVAATHLARGMFRHPAPEEFFAIANSASGRDLTWFFDATHRSGAAFDYGVESVTSVDTGTDAFDSTVVVRRFAEGVFPVDVRVVFADGSSVVERWNGREATHALKYRRGSSPETVEVDPDRVLVLDIARTNNSWSAHPRGQAAADAWSWRWAAWFQHLLLTYAVFV